MIPFRDDEEALRSALEQALREADLVLLSGGTSKGEGDLNGRIVAELDQPSRKARVTDFVLTDLDGVPRTLAGWTGKKRLLVAFSSW